MAKRKLDNLERDVVAAMRLGYGVHYGAYKADHPHTRDCSPIEGHKPALEAEKDVCCALCGKEFLRTYGGQKYCSEECREKAKKEREKKYYQRTKAKILPISCPECGRNFLPVSRRQKYCCTLCTRQAGWKAQVQRRKEAQNGKQ